MIPFMPLLLPLDETCQHYPGQALSRYWLTNNVPRVQALESRMRDCTGAQPARVCGLTGDAGSRGYRRTYTLPAQFALPSKTSAHQVADALIGALNREAA